MADKVLECQEIIVIKHTVEIVMDQLTSQVEVVVHYICLLYTSDAADE